jgi:hypothetical protein
LLRVFAMLGLAPPGSLRNSSLKDAWGWAIENWDIQRVPRRLNVRVMD